MTARFRIRTRRGHEVSFASPESFIDFVRSGDLSPDDLVYDGASGEWAPARTHPLVRRIFSVMEGRGPRPDRGKVTEAHFGIELLDPECAPRRPGPTDAGQRDPEEERWARAAEGMASLGGPDLTPTLDVPSPEEQAKAFLRKMDSERAMRRGLGDELPAPPSARVEGSATLADLGVPGPSSGTTEPRRSPTGRGSSATRSPWLRPRRPRRTAAAPEDGSRLRPAQWRWVGLSWLLTRAAIVVVLAAAVVAGWYLGADVIRLAIVASPVDDPEPVEAAPAGPAPVIAATEAAVRARANERFLTTTQPLLAALPTIPDVWMEAEYLVLPSEHPEVVDVWERYLGTVRRVRSGDRERYRLAYERALDDAGILDREARAQRLDRALVDFGLRARDIGGHWDRAEALATAALRSHEALVGVEGVVRYDPSGATGIRSGLGRGTSGRTEEADIVLGQVVDLIQRRLTADGGGPRERSNVREWVWGGVLDVMSR